MRSGVPTHHRAFAAEWQRAADVCDEKAAEIEKAVRHHDSSARPLSQLKIGSRVDLQDPTTGRWNRIGVIVGIGQRRTFLVRTASGRVLWRNRRYLRPYRPLLTEPAPAVTPPTQRSAPADPQRSASADGAAVTTQQPPPAAGDAQPSPAVEAAAPAPRRSRRRRRAPRRLHVQWGGVSYSD